MEILRKTQMKIFHTFEKIFASSLLNISGIAVDLMFQKKIFENFMHLIK